MKNENSSDANEGKLTPREYYEELGRIFPDLKVKIDNWGEDMNHFKMEEFGEYTQDQIRRNNVSELRKCFEFQNSKIETANDDLLNCMTVSYCEALLLGELRREVEEVVSLMGDHLRRMYKDYEYYYNELGKRPGRN